MQHGRWTMGMGRIGSVGGVKVVAMVAVALEEDWGDELVSGAWSAEDVAVGAVGAVGDEGEK